MSRFSVIVLSLLVGAAGFAADAPRFRGPNGDGKFNEQGLLKSWPKEGPPVAWIAKGLGQGYSSASVAEGRIFVAGMTADDQIGHIHILDMQGRLIGSIPYGKETVNDAASGARSTPTIDGNRLYILSGLGVVYCMDLDARSVRWSVNILERFHAENIEWRLSESLLVDGDRVICTPGGKEGGIT